MGNHKRMSRAWNDGTIDTICTMGKMGAMGTMGTMGAMGAMGTMGAICTIGTMGTVGTMCAWMGRALQGKNMDGRVVGATRTQNTRQALDVSYKKHTLK